PADDVAAAGPAADHGRYGGTGAASRPDPIDHKEESRTVRSPEPNSAGSVPHSHSRRRNLERPAPTALRKLSSPCGRSPPGPRAPPGSFWQTAELHYVADAECYPQPTRRACYGPSACRRAPGGVADQPTTDQPITALRRSSRRRP